MFLVGDWVTGDTDGGIVAIAAGGVLGAVVMGVVVVGDWVTGDTDGGIVGIVTGMIVVGDCVTGDTDGGIVVMATGMFVVGDCVTGAIDGGIVDIASGGPEGSSPTIVGDKVGAAPGGSVSSGGLVSSSHRQ
jgi:hypothetical protein